MIAAALASEIGLLPRTNVRLRERAEADLVAAQSDSAVYWLCSETIWTTSAGLVIQKPRNPSGSFSIGSQRTTFLSPRSFAAASLLLATISSHSSVWENCGQGSSHSRIGPNSTSLESP